MDQLKVGDIVKVTSPFIPIERSKQTVIKITSAKDGHCNLIESVSWDDLKDETYRIYFVGGSWEPGIAVSQI